MHSLSFDRPDKGEVLLDSEILQRETPIACQEKLGTLPVKILTRILLIVLTEEFSKINE